MRYKPLPAFLLLLACDDAPEKTTPMPGPAAVQPAQPAQELRTYFDASAVHVGDTIAGLVVRRVDVRPVPDDSVVNVSGAVAFGGEVELNGEYRPHFDFPEVREPCFWPDSAEWRKLPRIARDARTVWFCFSNPDSVQHALGELGSRRRARIVIDDYVTDYQRTDVWDRVRFIRVVQQQ